MSDTFGKTDVRKCALKSFYQAQTQRILKNEYCFCAAIRKPFIAFSFIWHNIFNKSRKYITLKGAMNRMNELHERRFQALRKVMAEQHVDCVVICNSPNLYYMTGYAPHKDERFQVVFVPQSGRPVAAIPQIYDMASKECDVEEKRFWKDGIDMLGFVKGIVNEIGVADGRIAIDDICEFRTFNLIRQAMPKSDFILGSNLFTVLRMRKSPEEIKLMEISGKLSDDATQMVIDQIMTGKSEAELKTWIEYELAQKGMRWGFSNLIAFGENTGSAHHVSGPRTAKQGDAIYLDLGGSIDHYWSDITRSLHVGKPDAEYIEVYNRVREAQQLAFEAIKPGVRACDVHMVAWNYLEKYGLAKYFPHRLGHGVGMDGHELPNLAKDSTVILEPGMTFSCEPGVYNGRWGVRIEDTVCVTETGAMSFNHFTKDLIIL